MTYGATLTELHVPDRTGKLADVVLGVNSFAPYAKGHALFGSTVGGVSNRIAYAQFMLDGQSYQLAANNGPNTLHGGLKGFDKKVWGASIVQSAAGPSVKLTLTSPDADEGFPGKLDVVVIYTLGNDNSIRIDYTAN